MAITGFPTIRDTMPPHGPTMLNSAWIVLGVLLLAGLACVPFRSMGRPQRRQTEAR